jgi:hypothetical protein
VGPGSNRIDVYARESNGNTVVRNFRVRVPGTKRIGGADRYEVSGHISDEIIVGGYGGSGYGDPIYGDPRYSGTVIIARGDLYTDALSGVSLAGLEGAPILLSDTRYLPNPIRYEIERLRA